MINFDQCIYSCFAYKHGYKFSFSEIKQFLLRLVSFLTRFESKTLIVKLS